MTHLLYAHSSNGGAFLRHVTRFIILTLSVALLIFFVNGCAERTEAVRFVDNLLRSDSTIANLSSLIKGTLDLQKIKVRTKHWFLGLTALGFCALAFLAIRNLPGDFSKSILWLSALVLPLVFFLYAKIRLSFFYSLMILGIPLGVTFSIVYLVFLLSSQNDPEGIILLVSTSLSFVFWGGALSAVGYFGHSTERPLQQGILKITDCLIAVGFFVFFLLGFVFINSFFLKGFFSLNSVSAFFDPIAAGVLLSIACIGIGATMSTGSSVLIALTNIFVCVSLIGAAFSTISWIVASLSKNMTGIGPAMALGLLTMLYGVIMHIVAFLLSLTVENSSQNLNLTTKNWHLVEGFTFLFFMTLGPPTMFELMSNS